MNETIGHNVHNTFAYAPRTMAYMERHHLTAIYRELLVALARDRPNHVRKYIAKTMPTIGARYSRTQTTVLAPVIFNARTMSLRYSRMYKAPVIQYTRARKEHDAADVLRKLRKFLRYHRIEQKNLIAFNFPGDRSECIDCIANDFAPTNVVEIIPGAQVPYKTREQCVQEDRPYVRNFEQVKKYFPERSVDLRFGPELLVPANPDPRDSLVEQRRSQPLVPSTMSAVCRHLQRIVREPLGQLGDHRYERLPSIGGVGRWYPRIVLIGRRGAGRKTQAALLARELGAIFVDVDYLVLKKIQSPEAIGQILAERERFHDRCNNPYITHLIEKRISKPDCLHNGYVLVGFGTCINDLRFMFEKFTVRPNRIIFLHCRERECKRRLHRQIKHQEQLAAKPKYTLVGLGRQQNYVRHTCAGIHLMMEPVDAYHCIEKEHIMYNMSIRPMVKYAGTQREVRHVNGTRSVRSVHADLMAIVRALRLDVHGDL